MEFEIAKSRVNPQNMGGTNIDVICPIRSAGSDQDVNCIGDKCMAFIRQVRTGIVDCRLMKEDK